MGRFSDNFQRGLYAFMAGRNGMDALARYALGAGIVLTVLDFLFGGLLLSVLSFAFLAYALFRCYSRNIGARATENARFESWLRKPRAALARLRGRWARRKDVKYLTCPQCGQSLSVPRGKGTLRVTCPKCHAQTTVKS